MKQQNFFKKTPVESYNLNGINVLVKREDMSVSKPAPPFSKVRGLIPALKKLKKAGYTTIGYTETSVSMAGWGVAWACQELGLKAVIFDPQYKEDPKVLSFHRKQWLKFSPDIIPIKAGMAKVNWYISKKILKEKYPNCILLPLGLPFEETIEETAKIAKGTFKKYKPKSVVVNIGSGTICAGLVRAAEDIEVFGIMGRTGSILKKTDVIKTKMGGKYQLNGLLKNRELLVLDPFWEYTEKSNIKCPFPCHPYYDRKAWQWLEENINHLQGPVMFWNIGR